MTAYVIADIQVTDAAAYEPYRPLAAASIARFGGRFVVRGGEVDLIGADREAADRHKAARRGENLFGQLGAGSDAEQMDTSELLGQRRRIERGPGVRLVVSQADDAGRNLRQGGHATHVSAHIRSRLW